MLQTGTEGNDGISQVAALFGLKKKKKDTDLTAFILADILNEQQATALSPS